jgi:preprotein translocase subunit SecF
MHPFARHGVIALVVILIGICLYVLFDLIAFGIVCLGIYIYANTRLTKTQSISVSVVPLILALLIGPKLATVITVIVAAAIIVKLETSNEKIHNTDRSNNADAGR